MHNFFYAARTQTPTRVWCIPQTQCSALLIKLWCTTNSSAPIPIVLLFNCFHIFLLYYLPGRFHLQWFRYGYLRRFITAIQNPSSVYRYWKEWHFTIRRALPEFPAQSQHNLKVLLKNVDVGNGSKMNMTSAKLFIKCSRGNYMRVYKHFNIYAHKHRLLHESPLCSRVRRACSLQKYINIYL